MHASLDINMEALNKVIDSLKNPAFCADNSLWAKEKK